jgi:hypothetical protein
MKGERRRQVNQNFAQKINTFNYVIEDIHSFILLIHHIFDFLIFFFVSHHMCDLRVERLCSMLGSSAILTAS